MKTVAPLTLLLCIGLTSQAWAGMVLSNDARVADRNLNWTSNSATVVLTRFSCLHRLVTAYRSRAFSGSSSSHAGARSGGGAGAGGGAGSSQSGGVGGGSPSSAAMPPSTPPFQPGIDDQLQSPVLPASASPFTPGIDDRVQRPLPPTTPSFTPGIDDRITRPFTPGIDDQVNLASGAPGSSTGTPHTPLRTVETPLQTGPTTQEIVAELVSDPNVTNIGSSQSLPLPGADIITAQAVPEPGSLALLALGLFALGTGRRRAGCC